VEWTQGNLIFKKKERREEKREVRVRYIFQDQINGG